MNRPLVSIITVVYNAASTLEATIDSVLSQNTSLFEYWIIDGGSTDESINIIRKYEGRLAGWITEPDKGIFDAMNKGIDRSKGDWLYFLGADDTLEPEVIQTISIKLIDPFKVVYGDVLFSNGHLMRSFLGYTTMMQNTLHHQGTFYHHSLFNNFRYDQSLPTQADYELNFLIYLRRVKANYVPLTVSLYRLGGTSAGFTDLSYNEINTIRQRHLKNWWKNALLISALRLYFWQKQFRFWLYNHQA
jgi:putative colanic acid biosynthesis glycosyltransferase